MDWSKIKTIFILTFLILDVYLFYQFLIIRDTNKYEYITEATVEEKLKADDIRYIEIPKAPLKSQYVSAKPKKFTKDDLGKLKGQRAYLKNGTIIHSVLIRALPVSLKFQDEEITSFLKSNLLYGDRYKFGERNDKSKTITYYQEYENKPFYKNISGKIIFTLNEENQIISYEQTYLEGIEKMTQKEDLLAPLKAVETLHQKGLLKPKSNVTKIELGYSTLIQLAASQVLAPTWHIVVDDKENFYVNGFEGQIIQFEEKNVVE
ncbi:MAG: two-component system regulatory protein YycI [Bacillota bacterium]|nr:two-component system regulatory protein YycI [Bacillota bacterium]MDP4170507.1 two-component system regulatory protein YycI [Bacillota bacterium]